MNDQYRKIADFYDDMVRKNRNYSEIATELAQIIGNADEVLEIGIGTGLVAELLLQIEPSYHITGIDTSQPLLDVAQKRLGEKVDLHCHSVAELDLDKKFDVIYSRGGAWTFVQDDSETFLASHIFSLSEIKKSFACVANHLKEDGVLIISHSNVYGDNALELDNGIIHKRVVNTELIGKNELYVILDYSFHRGENLLARQKLKLRLLAYRISTAMLKDIGLVEKAVEIGKYHIYARV